MTNEREKELRGKLLLEQDELTGKLRIARWEVRDRCMELWKVAQRLEGNPGLVETHSEAVLEKAPELIALVRDVEMLEKRNRQIDEALGK